MTLVALCPTPTAIPSAAGPANNSASASGFGAVMTDANNVLATAVSSAATVSSAVPVGTVASATPVPAAALSAAALLAEHAASVATTDAPDSPGKDAASKTADSAGDPESALATEQPAQNALPAVVLAIEVPLSMPSLAPSCALPPAALPPTTRAPADASSTMPSASSATLAAVTAGALAATAAVSVEAAGSSHASAVPLSATPTSTPLSTSLPLPASVIPPVVSPAASTLPVVRTKSIAVTADAMAGPIATSPARLEMVAAPIATSASPLAQNTPFVGQLARPIFTLATAGPGSHTMTISVTPDTLGPVMVRAHVGPEGIRVELFAPTDLGRDAIRAILPDLRKDLAGAGVGANLDLSSQNQPSDAGDRRGDAAPRSERAYVVPSGIVSDDDDNNVGAAPTRILTASSIDVLA